MRILLLGRGGQVGWELQRSLSVLGEVISLDYDSQDLCGDFSNPEGMAQTLRSVRPDVIVNAAAHTAVDKAESEPELARLLNATTPGVLAQEAKALGALLVHYSTDYVFDGSGDAARNEQAAVAPLSVYGQTKLEGEQLIAASGCRYLIFRTSWVYAARGANFAKTMLRLAKDRETLTVINDQFGAPTGADLLADVTAHAIRHVAQHPEHLGLYHCVAGGETTWHAYAQFVVNTARQQQPALELKVQSIEPVPTSAFPTPARRPLNSRLNTSQLQTNFGLQLPDWQHGVARMLQEIL
ncbi:MAG: dTDP-4-dehydrorhamnose reductase [Comamonas sp.]|jgi:dTDP-4-dehydrorhamnose reductase|nr:dTDP-4-dehydrorhamnose reductase [Comamonas sp.]